MRSPISWFVLAAIVVLAAGVIALKTFESNREEPAAGVCVPLSYEDGSWLCSYEGEDPRVEYRK